MAARSCAPGGKNTQAAPIFSFTALSFLSFLSFLPFLLAGPIGANVQPQGATKTGRGKAHAGRAHFFFFAHSPLLSLLSRCPPAPGVNFQATHLGIAPIGVNIQPQASGGGGERRVRGLQQRSFGVRAHVFLFLLFASSSISHTRTPVHVWILPTRAHPKTHRATSTARLARCTRPSRSVTTRKRAPSMRPSASTWPRPMGRSGPRRVARPRAGAGCERGTGGRVFVYVFSSFAWVCGRRGACPRGAKQQGAGARVEVSLSAFFALSRVFDAAATAAGCPFSHPVPPHAHAHAHARARAGPPTRTPWTRTCA